MYPWLFTSAILEGWPIEGINIGEMQRDFTYMDDIVEGTLRALDKVVVPAPNFNTDNPNPERTRNRPCRLYSIRNQEPVNLTTFIKAIEIALNVEEKNIFLPLQIGDVVASYANVDAIEGDVGFELKTSPPKGLGQ